MARILCVWSPNWAIANFKRRQPSASPGEGAGRPLVLIAAERGVRRLAAGDEAGAAPGVFIGQKGADAAALVPDLAAAEADPRADADALGALADWCVRFSPAVAPDPP